MADRKEREQNIVGELLGGTSFEAVYDKYAQPSVQRPRFSKLLQWRKRTQKSEATAPFHSNGPTIEHLPTGETLHRWEDANAFYKTEKRVVFKGLKIHNAYFRIIQIPRQTSVVELTPAAQVTFEYRNDPKTQKIFRHSNEYYTISAGSTDGKPLYSGVYDSRGQNPKLTFLPDLTADSSRPPFTVQIKGNTHIFSGKTYLAGEIIGWNNEAQLILTESANSLAINLRPFQNHDIPDITGSILTNLDAITREHLCSSKKFMPDKLIQKLAIQAHSDVRGVHFDPTQRG